MYSWNLILKIDASLIIHVVKCEGIPHLHVSSSPFPAFPYYQYIPIYKLENILKMVKITTKYGYSGCLHNRFIVNLD